MRANNGVWYTEPNGSLVLLDKECNEVIHHIDEKDLL